MKLYGLHYREDVARRREDPKRDADSEDVKSPRLLSEKLQESSQDLIDINY